MTDKPESSLNNFLRAAIRQIKSELAKQQQLNDRLSDIVKDARVTRVKIEETRLRVEQVSQRMEKELRDA